MLGIFPPIPIHPLSHSQTLLYRCENWLRKTSDLLTSWWVIQLDNSLSWGDSVHVLLEPSGHVCNQTLYDCKTLLLFLKTQRHGIWATKRISFSSIRKQIFCTQPPYEKSSQQSRGKHRLPLGGGWRVVPSCLGSRPGHWALIQNRSAFRSILCWEAAHIPGKFSGRLSWWRRGFYSAESEAFQSRARVC